MSLEKKLLAAATAAANEARLREKARILWCLDELKRETQLEFGKVLLVESTRHAAQVKLQLAVHVVNTVRRWIMSDVRPTVTAESDPILEKLKEIDDASGSNAVDG